jgi:ABC-type antimicrobial peptide transport system permease subunit
MNNIRTVSAIAAVFIAATLVVSGTSATITTTHSAFAWKKDGQDKYMKGGEGSYKKGGEQEGSKNGNTNTIQVLKQNAKASKKHSEVDQTVKT